MDRARALRRRRCLSRTPRPEPPRVRRRVPHCASATKSPTGYPPAPRVSAPCAAVGDTAGARRACWPMHAARAGMAELDRRVRALEDNGRSALAESGGACAHDGISAAALSSSAAPMGSSGLGALLSDQQQRLSDELKQRRAALSVAALADQAM